MDGRIDSGVWIGSGFQQMSKKYVADGRKLAQFTHVYCPPQGCMSAALSAKVEKSSWQLVSYFSYYGTEILHYF